MQSSFFKPIYSMFNDDAELRMQFKQNMMHLQYKNVHAGGTDGTAPSEMKAYVNREDLDFGTVADLPPVQKWDLQENLRGEIEYPTQCVSSPFPSSEQANCAVRIVIIAHWLSFSQSPLEPFARASMH